MQEPAAQPEIRSLASGVAVHASDSGSIGALNYGEPLSILGSAPLPHLPWWQRLAPSTIFVLLSAAIALLFLSHELLLDGKLGFPTDAGWKEQVYARNFFRDIAFEFNAGERTATPAAPFWTVVLALALGLFHNAILAAKLLGTIFLFLAGFYSYRLLRSLEMERGVSLLGGALIATSSSLAWCELSGLPVCLCAAIIIGALWWYVSAPPSRWIYNAATGALFALATLTRPEAALIFAILLAAPSIERRGSWLVARAIMLGGFLVTVAPIAITNAAVSGHVVPAWLKHAIGPDSILTTFGSGDLSGIGRSLVAGCAAVWQTTHALYLAQNPIWVASILLAIVSLLRRRLVAPRPLDRLFILLAVLLVAYPFVLGAITGSAVALTSHSIAAVLLAPLFQLTGVLSLAILAQRELLRTVSPRQALVGITIFVLIASVAYGIALAGSEIIPATLPALFALLFFGVAMRHATLRITKHELAPAVTEEERQRMSFHMEGDGIDDTHLPAHAVRVLRGALLISMAWNLAMLPVSAKEFSEQVFRVNTSNIVMARTIATMTQPTDVIASDAIGTLGYFSERRVVDVRDTLSEAQKPNYIALFNRGSEPSKQALAKIDGAALYKVAR